MSNQPKPATKIARVFNYIGWKIGRLFGYWKFKKGRNTGEK